MISAAWGPTSLANRTRLLMRESKDAREEVQPRRMIACAKAFVRGAQQQVTSSSLAIDYGLEYYSYSEQLKQTYNLCIDHRDLNPIPLKIACRKLA
jgi:hypothetical protein